MNVISFANLLETLGVPVACNHFKEPQQAPFIIYLDDGSENFGADNIVYHETINVTVELYSEIIDDMLESRIKQLFTDNSIYYDWTRVWIEANKQYQTTYEVSL